MFLSYDYWNTLSEIPPLQEEETHLWYICLDLPQDKVKDFRYILSEEEQKRADRFHFENHQRYYTLGRAVLRIILSKYLQISPLEIDICYGQYGKPFVREEIEFNLSHSQNLALLAVNKNKRLGVDIEYMRESVSFEDIAKRYFSTHEVEELDTLPAAEKKLAFFRGWTRKEAYVKAIGDGLTMPLSNFNIPLMAVNNLTIHHKQENNNSWGLWNIEVVTDYTAAIVVETLNTKIINFLM